MLNNPGNRHRKLVSINWPKNGSSVEFEAHDGYEVNFLSPTQSLDLKIVKKAKAFALFMGGKSPVSDQAIFM